MTYKIIRLIIRLLIKCLIRLEVIGLENMPKTGALVTIGNHNGRFDATLVYSVLDRKDIILMVAEKYKKSAIWRWLVKKVDALWIDRYNADFGTVRECLRRIQAGGILAMSPEGTRSQTGTLQPGKPGAAYLAVKAGVPIVPVGIIGSEDAVVFPRLKRLKRAHITARVGKPFTLPPLPTRDREAVLQQYTDEMMCRIAVLLPPSYRGVYTDHPRLKELLSENSARS